MKIHISTKLIQSNLSLNLNLPPISCSFLILESIPRHTHTHTDIYIYIKQTEASTILLLSSQFTSFFFLPFFWVSHMIVDSFLSTNIFSMHSKKKKKKRKTFFHRKIRKFYLNNRLSHHLY
jgi:hypothetical protein